MEFAADQPGAAARASTRAGTASRATETIYQAIYRPSTAIIRKPAASPSRTGRDTSQRQEPPANGRGRAGTQP